MSTQKFITHLTDLKKGDLGLLRCHMGKGLDESIDGFDLFTGLWWPLRQKNQRAPRREVAWLIAKLYAFRPLEQSEGATLFRQLGRLQPKEKRDRKRLQQKVDAILLSPFDKIEPLLQWALNIVGSGELPLDWVKLTDKLSIWEREKTRREWAEEFLKNNERGKV